MFDSHNLQYLQFNIISKRKKQWRKKKESASTDVVGISLSKKIWAFFSAF